MTTNINQLKQLLDLLGDTEPEPAPDGTLTDNVRIVIAQRGWVFVGRYSEHNDRWTLTDAAVIRVWGTEGKGLGALRDGPTSATKLDPAGTVRGHILGQVATINCDADKWKSHL